MVVPSGSERIHIEGDIIGCTDPYAMVNSRHERFLEAKKSIGYVTTQGKALATSALYLKRTSHY